VLNLTEFRTKLKGFADLLNYAALVDDGIVLNKDGSLTAAWTYRGTDLESASPTELATLSSRLNAQFRRLGSGWMMQVDMIRKRCTLYPTRGEFPDRTSRLIDEERRARFLAAGDHFETSYVLGLTYLAPPDDVERLTGFLVDESNDDRLRSRTALQSFQNAVSQFVDATSSDLGLKHLRRQRYSKSGLHRCDLLGHLNTCITGEDHPILEPAIPMYLDCMLGSADFYADLRPRIGAKHIRTIAIVGYPAQSYPGMSDFLQHLPFEYRWSSRFIFLDRPVAEKHIAGYEKKWFGRRKSLRTLIAEQSGGAPGPVNSHADEMSSDAQAALSENASGAVTFGYFTSVVIIMDEDQSVADRNAQDVVTAINHAGFNARIEDVNAVEAYLGSLPGHGFPNIRRPLMHTLNVADLLPTTAVWSGLTTNPCPFYPPESPPLACASTGGATPFRLSLHVNDVGHTLVVGPTGSGKSTLLGFLIAQHFRYPGAQVFAFDKGHSAYALCAACGGEHYDVAGDDSKLCFYPLGQIAEQSERIWAADWLETLARLQGLVVKPHHRVALIKALGLLASSDRRTLTDFVGTLQDVELRDALTHFTLAGAMGTLLDSESDTLENGDFQVFEIDQLLELGPKNAIPVLLYLFHRIERRLQGRPSLLVLDEAWAMLESDLFESKIREWLKTLRKANAAVIFCTHSPIDILESRIASTIVESCPTKFWLPNPQASSTALSPAYERLGLTSRQIEIISDAVPKRHYYYCSPLGRRLIDLELGDVALSFIGAGGKEDLRMVKSLQERFGQAWPAAWLQLRGLDGAAQSWLDYCN